jgi:DNA-binding transcriptional LysR family regulator
VIRAITVVNLSSLDLNLFLVLHTVLVEGSATRAAERLHVTQSAVSNALARLRSALDDQLVVRTSRGLVPTQKAAQLMPHLAKAMEQLRAAVEVDTKFDAATTTRAFTMACSDYEEIVVLPAIVDRMIKHMPRAEIRVVTIDHLLASNGLETGEIDVLVGMPPALPPGCLAEQLFEDGPVCVVRKDHPFDKAEMTLEDFIRYPHVHTAVTVTAKRRIDATLAEKGLQRHVALTVPQFTIAAMSVLRNDYLAPFAQRMALALAESLPIRIIRVPELENLPRLTTSLVWHARTDPDPGAREFRDIVRRAAGTVPALSPRVKKLAPPRPLTKKRTKRA